jgi:hypothetical protein
MEIKKYNSLPFLNVLISRLPDGSLTHQVYRNKTHVDRYLHAQSHHHPTQKSIVLKTLVSRAIQIFVPHFLKNERAYVTKALMFDGYSLSQINKAFRSTRNQNSKNSNSTSQPLALISLPYI